MTRDDRVQSAEISWRGYVIKGKNGEKYAKNLPSYIWKCNLPPKREIIMDLTVKLYIMKNHLAGNPRAYN